MKKEQRQQKLIQLIQQLKHVTAAELAERLEVSKRTVLRDIQELETQGVHLQTITGQKGGYRLQSQMNHNALTFSDDEMQALYLVLNESLSLSTLPYQKEITAIKDKLLRHPNVTLRQNIQHMSHYIRIDQQANAPLPRLFTTILVYCHERKVMALEYHRTTAQHPMVENVVFIGLLCEAGNWRAVVYHIGGGYTKLVDIAEINDISYSFYKSIHTQDITMDNYESFLQQ
ncbi:helix-turn-helix transcriptional regulator [Staphylococcus rostri]|uniref:DNA-binding transcriptional regulator n=1 Tax=Staphylococcus rostri TaxID=522262 RepID=A0A2K3YU65_9STAP|nr:HTH domain-containing protein [Staphylococcus rostri]MDO5375389.1 HTH domain-containing protein [Staphylococcus rostri]PNZ29152.1 DNA-binding transcriptional regulator [Staphylococcus rostri]